MSCLVWGSYIFKVFLLTFGQVMNAQFNLREVSAADFPTKFIKPDPSAEGEVINKFLVVCEVTDSFLKGRLLHTDLCRSSVQWTAASLSLLAGFAHFVPGGLKDELFMMRGHRLLCQLPCTKKQRLFYISVFQIGKRYHRWVPFNISVSPQLTGVL